jgi:intracellular sulfur oxidation DsrE/DsrF family protein
MIKKITKNNQKVKRIIKNIRNLINQRTKNITKVNQKLKKMIKKTKKLRNKRI